MDYIYFVGPRVGGLDGSYTVNNFKCLPFTVSSNCFKSMCL